MTERAPTDRALSALVLHPEDPETAETAAAIESDLQLAARTLELSALRHLLRSMGDGVYETGPTAEELARYATDPRSLAPSDRERIRLHANLSAETRNEIDALRRFLHEASRSKPVVSESVTAAPARRAWLDPRLWAGVLTAAALVLGVFVGRRMTSDHSPEVGVKSIASATAPPDPCVDPELTDWGSIGTREVTVCGVALEEDPGGLGAVVPTEAIAEGTRLRVTHPESERSIVVTVSGHAKAGLALTGEALDRLGVTAAEASRGTLLRVRIERSEGGHR